MSTSLLLAIPGGLFEVALGLILMAHGLPDPVALPLVTQLRAANARLGASA
jgi:hypothetical protein